MLNMSFNGHPLAINYSILRISLHYIIWNHLSKVHQLKERQDNKDMSIYNIDMKIYNGCWISNPQVEMKVYT